MTSCTGSSWPNARAREVALALTAIAISVMLTQFGSLGCQLLDPDESSFILMGSDVAAGNLPYVAQFDLKPPAIFLLIGGIVAMFGKSLLAIRLFGDFCLLITAFMAYLVARRMTGAAAALGGALIYVALASPGLGQPTLSELPATAFLMTAAWLLCSSHLALRNSAVAGCLVSLAILTRTNLFPAAAGLGLLILAANVAVRSGVARYAWLAFGLGGLLPPALLILVYAAAGELETLKLAMIDVPLAYAGQIGPADLLAMHVQQYYVWTTIQPALFIPATLLTAAGAIRAAVLALRVKNSALGWPLAVVATLAVCIGISLLTGGAAYPHYWLQLTPLMGVFCALAIAAAERLVRPIAASALLVAVPLGSAVAAHAADVKRAIAPSPGNPQCDVRAAAAHIEKSGMVQPRVWAWYDHLVLWYLGSRQLSPAGVHPDNLARRAIIDTLTSHGYVGGDEIGRIMRELPDFVVTDAGGRGLGWLKGDGRPVEVWLAANYRLDGRFGDVLVYRRTPPHDQDSAAQTTARTQP